MMTARALAQQTLDFDINGVTGSHMGHMHQMIEVLMEKLLEEFPDLDALHGLPEPVTERDIRRVIEDAGLTDRVSFEFGQFPQ